MSDFISREAAITTYKTFGHLNLRNALEAFEEIPAADVRPVVRAHWYWDKDGMDWNIGAWRCSACCRGNQHTAYGYVWRYADET